MISEPGAAKTLAWPGGAGVALPGKGEGGVHAFLLGGPGRPGQSSGHKVLCLKIEKLHKKFAGPLADGVSEHLGTVSF